MRGEPLRRPQNRLALARSQRGPLCMSLAPFLWCCSLVGRAASCQLETSQPLSFPFRLREEGRGLSYRDLRGRKRRAPEMARGGHEGRGGPLLLGSSLLMPKASTRLASGRILTHIGTQPPALHNRLPSFLSTSEANQPFQKVLYEV